MRLELMNKLNLIATYVFEEITDIANEKDISKDFWKYLRSRLLNDMNQKVKISEYIYYIISKINVKEFNKKYSVKLDNVKKSKQQLDFLCSAVSILLHYSDYGNKMIEWS